MVRAIRAIRGATAVRFTKESKERRKIHNFRTITLGGYVVGWGRVGWDGVKWEGMEFAKTDG